MPFESLSERLQMSLRRLTGRGKINENDIDEIMKEVRVSLLEADVNYKIVKSFIADIKEKALGERVMKSLTPGDQVLKIVNEELRTLMGEEASPINMNQNGTTVILFAGLQGSGIKRLISTGDSVFPSWLESISAKHSSSLIFVRRQTCSRFFMSQTVISSPTAMRSERAI